MSEINYFTAAILSCSWAVLFRVWQDYAFSLLAAIPKISLEIGLLEQVAGNA